MSILITFALPVKAEVEVSNAYIRDAIPGAENTAAYLTLQNKTDKDLVLVSASSNVAQNVEFHDHILVDGNMRMVKKPKLIIKANASVVFKSGGLHIMFIDLQQQLGKEVTVTLNFEGAEAITLTLPVKSIHHEHHHHH